MERATATLRRMDMTRRTLSAACAAAAVLMLGGCAAAEVDAGRAGGASQRDEAPEGLLQAGTDPIYQREPAASADAIRVRPRLVRPGDIVALTFPRSKAIRGVAFSLASVSGERWRVDYYLTSDANETEPSWWPAAEERGWPDVGVGGSGPDRLVIPDTADGRYLLCTANAIREQCGFVTVAVNVTE